MRNDLWRFRAAHLLWAQNLARRQEKPPRNKPVLGLGERMCKVMGMSSASVLCGRMKASVIRLTLKFFDKVGRVTPCAPRCVDVLKCGAHGVTRPTLVALLSLSC